MDTEAQILRQAEYLPWHQRHLALEVFDIRSIVHRKNLAHVELLTAIFLAGQIPGWSDVVSTTGHRDADR